MPVINRVTNESVRAWRLGTDVEEEVVPHLDKENIDCVSAYLCCNPHDGRKFIILTGNSEVIYLKGYRGGRLSWDTIDDFKSNNYIILKDITDIVTNLDMGVV